MAGRKKLSSMKGQARGTLSRRSFMKSTAGAAVAAGVASRLPSRTAKAAKKEARGWKNWSGWVTCDPKYMERPKSETEVVELVTKAAKKGLVVRTTGSGHSFTEVCATDGMLISLAEMRGVTAIDSAKLQATVLGGTKLQQMHVPLREAGLAMENISDIDRQAITGAIATGTHGTGHGIRSISNQIVALRLVTASGDVLECSNEKNPEIFKAAQVSVGALGIITEVTMQCMPTYRLHEKLWELPFDECFEQLDALISDNRHFEFFWMPRTDLCHIKTLNITEAQPDPMPDKKRERIGHSDKIFPSVRSMRFNEIEFSLPEKEGPSDLTEVRDLLKKKHSDVAMPLEYRTVGQDDIYISPAQGRDTITLSAHRSARYPFADFFKDVEAIHRNHSGRPHWGKVHTHTTEELAGLYPLWDKFLSVRKEIDPGGMFLNGHLKSIFT